MLSEDTDRERRLPPKHDDDDNNNARSARYIDTTHPQVPSYLPYSVVQCQMLCWLTTGSSRLAAGCWRETGTCLAHLHSRAVPSWSRSSSVPVLVPARTSPRPQVRSLVSSPILLIFIILILITYLYAPCSTRNRVVDHSIIHLNDQQPRLARQSGPVLPLVQAPSPSRSSLRRTDEQGPLSGKCHAARLAPPSSAVPISPKKVHSKLWE